MDLGAATARGLEVTADDVAFIVDTNRRGVDLTTGEARRAVAWESSW